MSKDLLANLAVIIAAAMIYATFAGWLADKNRKLSPWIFALVMAASTFATMEMRFEVAAGVFLDFRSPVIAAAGLFGGLPAAFLATATAIAYRVYLGGGAAWLGVATTLVSALIGLGVRFWPGSHFARIKWLTLAAGGVSATTAIAFSALFLNGSAITLGEAALHTGLTFATALLLGLLLATESVSRRLALSNHQYRAMVDALPDCLNIKDREGRFLAANPATAQLMGAPSVHALIGKTDADFYPRELAEIYAREDRDAISGNQPKIVDQQGLAADGSAVWLSTLKTPAYDSSGAFVGLITSNRDVTAKRALQSELERMQAYFNQALQQMSDGLAIFDEAGVLQFSNDPYRALFSRTARLRVPGKLFSDIVKASVLTGEEVLREGVTIEEHCASRLASLFVDGDYRLNMWNNRTYEARTRVLDNGHVLSVIANITDRVNREVKLKHMALHDPLTELPNRAYFDSEFMSRLEAVEDPRQGVVLMLVDLDHFKQVNDNHGHLAGDAVLVEVAKRMKKTLRRHDFIARLGGDEFGVLLAESDSETRDTDVANRLLKAIGRPISFNGETLKSGATIGIARATKDDSPTQLVQRADQALYAAKEAGRGTWQVHGAYPIPRAKTA